MTLPGQAGYELLGPAYTGGRHRRLAGWQAATGLLTGRALAENTRRGRAVSGSPLVRPPNVGRR